MWQNCHEHDEVDRTKVKTEQYEYNDKSSFDGIDAELHFGYVAGPIILYPLNTLYTPFIAVHTPMYTRYACIYIIYTPYGCIYT